ncbi:MAG: zinc-ribbon domain-containing protein [Deltaproteobacteria bacterium]|nr:zinc-ribbon domain-containing protein [Deltaproteobacteria bacterium]
MFKVECESCKAPYQIDERRLPAGGLKMRCPQCGATFQVQPPGGVALAAPKPPGPPSPPRSPGRTMLGAGPKDGGADLPAPAADLPAPAASRKLSFDLPSPDPRKLSFDMPGPGIPEPPAASRKLSFDLPGQGGLDDDNATTSLLTGEMQRPDELASISMTDELDLPAPAADLPARSTSARAKSRDIAAEADKAFGDLDLPVPRSQAAQSADDDLLDLPAAAADLPAPRRVPPPPGHALGGATLPRGVPPPPAPTSSAGGRRGPPPGVKVKPSARGPTGTEFDRPIAGAGVAVGGAVTAGLDGGLDLPAPAAELPTAARRGAFGDLDLPMPAADLPIAKEGTFGDLDLPAPAADVPAPKTGVGFGDLDLPAPAADFPQTKGAGGFGGLDLPAPDLGPPPGGAASFGEIDLGAPPAPPPRTGGGQSFGEVDLGGLGGMGGTDGLEFGELPQADATATHGGRGATTFAKPPGGIDTEAARPVVKRGRTMAPTESELKAKKKSNPIVIGLLVIVLVLGAGAALGLTDLGFFGIRLIEAYLPGSGDPAQIEQAMMQARHLLVVDTYDKASQARQLLRGQRQQAHRNREIAAYSAYVESMFEIRFGQNSGAHTTASSLIGSFQARADDTARATLAQAAFAARGGELAKARQLAATARNRLGATPEVLLLTAEVELRAREHDAALATFEQASRAGGGAAAMYGMARVQLAKGQRDAAAALFQQALTASARHVGARIGQARLAWTAQPRREEIALRLLGEALGETPVDGQPLVAGPVEKVDAYTLLGQIRLKQGQLRIARQSFERALAVDPTLPVALAGAGEVLLLEHRFQEARARFDAALSADPDLVDAALGSARAMLALEDAGEARSLMDRIRREHPNDAQAALLQGRALAALNLPRDAEASYRDSIRLGPREFEPYLALAQLFFAQGRPNDASAILTEATSQVEETAAVRRQLGETELQRGDLAKAEREFRRAIELDPNDLQAGMGLAVTLRRAGRLPEAAQLLDRIARRNETLPGLAVERGMLFESMGRAEEAVRHYQSAVQQSPDDLDLKLRLGAAQVAANQLEAAEQTLQAVSQARPNSAEAEFLFGRVQFARRNFTRALEYFSRAVQLDATRAEYRLYLGWASLELGNLGRALQEIDAALIRDPSMGDGFWLRGVIRRRTANLTAARADLEAAIRLRPNRFDALHELGKVFEEMRNLPEAVRYYALAVQASDANGEWHYDLGRVHLDSGDRASASGSLARATLLGEALDPRPAWVADAHRLYGDTQRLGGQRASAIEHYRRYLELAPANAIDRQEVMRQLRDLDAL